MVAAGVVRYPDVVIVESVKFLKEGRAALVAEGLQENEILPVLQGGILDVLDRLEKWCDFSCHLTLLFGF